MISTGFKVSGVNEIDFDADFMKYLFNGMHIYLTV